METNDTVEKTGSINWFDYTVHYAAISDRGRVRKANEDAFLILEEEVYFGVADGAGGHENGARASFLTVQGIETYLKKTIDGSDDTVPIDTVDALSLTAQAIHSANHKVFRESNGGNMASTIVGCQLHQDKLLLEHVGDSRCYLYRNKQLKQLTEDHSFVNDLFRSGKIDREDMKTHKFRNVITRAIGVSKEVVVDSQWVDCMGEDIFLLCSDGLTGFVSDEYIAAALSVSQPLHIIAKKLVAQANQAGGRDNITVILLKFDLSEKTIQLRL